MHLHRPLPRELPEMGQHRGRRLAVAGDDVEQPHLVAAAALPLSGRLLVPRGSYAARDVTGAAIGGVNQPRGDLATATLAAAGTSSASASRPLPAVCSSAPIFASRIFAAASS